MTYYVITKDGKLVGVTKENAYEFNLSDVNIHEFDDVIPDLNQSHWDQDLETFVKDSNILTKLAFLNRFTVQERIAIRSSSDPIVMDIMNLLEIAEFVDATDPKTVQGVGYLYMVGLISASRVSEILA